MSEIIMKVQFSDGGYSMTGFRTDGDQIEITHLKGRMLNVRQVATCLKAWNETYNLIKKYECSQRRFKFEILEKKKHVGRSTDLVLKVYKFINNFCVPFVADRIHISSEDKLNQNYVGYIGDLVELLRYYDAECNDIFLLGVKHNNSDSNNIRFNLGGFYGMDAAIISYNQPQQCKNPVEKFTI